MFAVGDYGLRHAACGYYFWCGVEGGSLITAEIAQSYDRAVFAFPGNFGQQFSEGCNNLIRDNGAGLISNAEDFVKAMGWYDDSIRKQALANGIEWELFPDLSPEEKKIVSLLQQTNDNCVARLPEPIITIFISPAKVLIIYVITKLFCLFSFNTYRVEIATF